MEDANVLLPRVCSCRNLCRVMYLGVIAPPNKNIILMERSFLKGLISINKGKNKCHIHHRSSLMTSF